MMYKRPFRLTTLHLAQRFLIDDETFICYSSASFVPSFF
jgi:hypothetical protein